MLRKLFRRSQQIAEKAVGRSSFDGAERLQFLGEKVDVEFAAQVPPGGTVWYEADCVVHPYPFGQVGESGTTRGRHLQFSQCHQWRSVSGKDVGSVRVADEEALSMDMPA
jgi:hypothetical protein